MTVKELEKLYQSRKCGIKERLNSFKALSEVEQQKEFVYCTLTPQSNAKKCWEAVEQIFKIKQFRGKNLREILKSKTRFYNNKAKYIIQNREIWYDLQSRLDNTGLMPLRDWLSDNAQGYGMKEASHFLRNIGKSNNQIAILDRHILRNLKKYHIIQGLEIKSKKDYLEKEKKYIEFANRLGIPSDELDLLLWSKENGEIFK